MTGTGRTVGVVGLGLVGGSLAQALLARDVQVVATTRSPATRADAADAGITVVDDVAAVVGEADLVVLATPLPVLEAHLGEVAAVRPADGSGPTVTDVGSVKAPLAAAARRLADPGAVVPGHPMAGTERVGWAAADPRLFEGRRWALVVEEPVDLSRWADVAALATAVGSEVVPVEAGAHDAAVALVSHLPYVLAATAAALLDADPDTGLARSLAAGSFADLTRVAGGHPSLGAEMATANAAALAPRLEATAARLQALAATLAAASAGSGDPSGSPTAAEVAAAFAAGHAGRSALDRAGSARPDRTTARLDRAGLVALGRRGGTVTAVHPAAPGAEELEVSVVDAGEER